MSAGVSGEIEAQKVKYDISRHELTCYTKQGMTYPVASESRKTYPRTSELGMTHPKTSV